jgi:monoamine oxidase
MLSQHLQVLVIGAGAAGLAAARVLRQRAVQVRVLEARDRVGGRIWTQHDAVSPPLELGAEFVHGKHPLLWSMLRRARLRTGHADGPHWLLENGRWRRADQVFEDVAEVFAKAGSPEESIKRFVQRIAPRRKRLRRLAMLFAEGFFAAETDRISAAFIGKMSRASAASRGDEIFRILDGYDRLAAFLARGLTPGKELWLNAQVQRVRWSHHRVEVFAQTARKIPLPLFEADRAVVTVPLGVLRASPAQGGILFQPPLREKEEPFRRLEMGPVVKILLRFRQAPWTQGVRRASAFSRFGFAHVPAAPVPTWWRTLPFNDSRLVGWAGGPRARRLSHRPQSWILDRGLESLRLIFGLGLAELERLLESARVVDWQADPFSRGGYCVVPVGGVPLQEQLARPVQDTLFFAGEAVHTEGFAGTVHGAMETGENAARAVLRSLRAT